MLFLICSEIIVLQLAKIEHFAQIYHPLGKKVVPSCFKTGQEAAEEGEGTGIIALPGRADGLSGHCPAQHHAVVALEQGR